MEDEVTQALVAAGVDAADIQVEVTPSGNVGGFIVSSRFSDLSQIERQERLWAELKQRLRPETLRRMIVSILTMTPAEGSRRLEREARNRSGRRPIQVP